MDTLVLSDKQLIAVSRPTKLMINEAADLLLLTLQPDDRRMADSRAILLDRTMALELMSYLEMWVLEQAPLPAE